MNIGIFGDSFADATHVIRDRCWPTYLKNNLNANSIDYHAQSGTSLWYSYQKFLKHRHNYNVVVFSFTSSSRWPHLPNELNGKEYNVGIHKDSDEFINKIVPLFFTLFSKELLLFLNQSIHRSIVEICERENIYLVQLFPFVNNGTQSEPFDFTLTSNKFPIISGLDQVSRNEELIYNGQRTNAVQVLHGEGFFDHRGCHLNISNNKILANYISDCVKQEKYNIHFEADQAMNFWEPFDQYDSDYFNEVKETRKKAK